MIDPIELNPSLSQYLYQPEGTPTVNSPMKDRDQQQADSISDGIAINHKSKSGNTLQGKIPKDCKT
jgi:hypothetical protein